jgi:predicted phage terminase large subunit-like protein
MKRWLRQIVDEPARALGLVALALTLSSFACQPPQEPKRTDRHPAFAAVGGQPLYARALSWVAERLRAAAEQASFEEQIKASPTLSLRAFIEDAWEVVEPDAPFVTNWHIDAICAHLEAISRGEIRNLLINIPPGCMKSYITSVMWPAWEWTKKPHYRYLCVSYQQSLSTRDNRRCRQIIESEWYQARWPYVQLAHDQNTLTKYTTTRGGWRIGTTVNGVATGEHPHRKIVDDPHSVKDSESEVEREFVTKTFFDRTLSSRGRALKAATIVTMQRLHQDDLSGHILSRYREDWTHLCLPMRYEPPAPNDKGEIDLATGALKLEPRMPVTPIGFQDPRTVKGELLWPRMFDEKEVTQQEGQLLEFGTAGQMQQRPIPEGGAIVKLTDFEIVDAIPGDARISARVRGWDGAGTEGGGDDTAGVRLAVTDGGIVFVEDAVAAQVGPGADEALMLLTAQNDPVGTEHYEEQEGGSSGKKVCHAHAAKLKAFAYFFGPTTGNKVQNFKPFASQARVGNVKILRGPWNKKYLDQVTSFPNAKHDDLVDATSRAYNRIVNGRTTVRTVKLKGI